MKQHNPPKFITWLLTTFCPEYMIEDLVGDLQEEFRSNCNKYSKRKAKWNYTRDALSLLFSYALRKRKKDHSLHTYATTQINIAMLKNYIKVALRSLGKQKLFTGINILGLSAGMSIGILFITMIAFVKTYDNFHTNRDDIYRIITNADDKVDLNRYASSPAPLAQILKDEHSGFGQIVRINNTLKREVKFGIKELPVSGLFVDSNFLDVFSFQKLKGSADLNDPYGILLTESFATKLFSDTDPIGEVISMGQLGDFTVKGIMKDVPQNSHIWFEALVPYQTLEKLSQSGIINTNLKEWKHFRNNYTYFKLPKDRNVDNLTATLNKIGEEKYSTIDLFDVEFKIQHLSDIALGSDTKNEVGTSWGTEIYLISIAFTLLILLPACFNYANISTARALSRAKEIGLRKVVGGVKRQIFLQFILETIIVSLISLIGAYFIFSLIRTEFQNMLVSGLTSLNFQITPLNLVYSILFAIFTGVMAGIFPALHFAGIQPIAALKKTAKSQILGKVNIQKTLLVIQFALSFGFIMGIVVLVDEYQTTMNHDLGFNEENILDVNLQDTKPENLRIGLNNLSAVQQISMSSDIMGVNSNNTIWIKHNDDSIHVTQMFIDHNYMDNLGLELVAGTGFDQKHIGNERFVIVNERFIEDKGFESAGAAVGEPVAINDSTELVIAGVVQNFHFQNLRYTIEPLLFRNNPEHFNYANLKITSQDIAGTMIQIEDEWKKISPHKLEAKFFSDELDEAFNIYSSVIKIFLFLALLAITISCLGLLGMVVFNTQNRTKEVGIRKVMGAPVLNITYLLTKDFMKLMIIGSLISIPISYMIFTVIITQSNAYSTGIGVLPVLLSLFILFALGLLTVISETWKAATANPTDTLRYE